MKILITLFLISFLFFGCAAQQTSQQSSQQPPAAPTAATPQAPPSWQKAPSADDKPPAPPEDIKTAPVPETKKQFKILVHHSGYSPASITVNKNDKVILLFNTAPGQDWHKHGVAIDEFKVNKATRSMDDTKPDAVEFTADKSGEFKIYCKTCNDEDGWKGKTGSTHPNIQATLIVK